MVDRLSVLRAIPLIFLNARFYDLFPNSTSFMDTLIEELYCSPPFHEINLHRLGLLFMVLAMAVQHDQAKPLYSDESYKYFNLAKACLASRGMLENPSMSALQALVGYFVLI